MDKNGGKITRGVSLVRCDFVLQKYRHSQKSMSQIMQETT